MAQDDPIKLQPRNASALRRGQNERDAVRIVVGNAVSTRLESGVGNCFPGLECDLRNLERRFFPFLEIDVQQTATSLAEVVAVDLAGVQNAVKTRQLTKEMEAIYQEIARTISQSGSAWVIERITGTFGPLGPLVLGATDLGPPGSGPNRRPPDAWTAIRLLTEGTEVQLVLRRQNQRRTVVGKRARYLDDNGALASMFLPGELTQSLCSPWTHDFRDCGCFYWASNHPDIAKPPLPSPIPNVPEVNSEVPWERADRGLRTLPAPATSESPAELSHYEINSQWQTLNFVLDGRETVTPYEPGTFVSEPFATKAELETNLRYAAGVELAVLHEYLAAAFSLKLTGLSTSLLEDVTAAHAELMRIAIGEMRHLRAVNDVLMSLHVSVPFVPALRVARNIPGNMPGTFRPVTPRPALPEVIQAFIEIEQPSRSVDGVYSRILATLERDGTHEQRQTVRSIMAEGEDHFETFRFIQEWLGNHDPGDYLRRLNLAVPPPINAQHTVLQQRYKALLEELFNGYRLGVPAGSTEINAARNSMLGVSGLEGAAEAVAEAGFLVSFDVIADNPDLAPLDSP